MSNEEMKLQENNKILRFPTAYRIEHWVFAISFIILGITGLVQKFFQWPVSVWLINVLGGIENVRLVHRISATVMMVAVVYHLGIVAYRIYVRRYRLSMMPGLDDAKNALGWFLYNIGLRKKYPQEGRYTYGEKIEYWAVVWGTVIMVVTGFMMWNPIATTQFLDGQWIPAAKVAHGGEAVLAILAIIIWHFYHVLVRTFNRSMFSGYLTEEQMEEEHPLELADIKAGTHDIKVDPQKKQQRQRVFIPIYSIVGGLLMIGIVWFVTFEQTALETIEPIDTVEVFSPLTPTLLPTQAPTPTLQPTPETGGVDWDTLIGPMLQDQCGACHGATALGGLDLTTYQGALDGGDTGPAVVPGEPGSSYLLVIQNAGNHPGQLNDADLNTVEAWINAGAPESLAGSASGTEEPPGEVLTYQDNMSLLFEEQCGACHGATALGGLNLLTYESTLAGGDSGPAIVPGDPESSSLITLQEEGGHPGQFTEAELEQVRSWIEQGAFNTAEDAAEGTTSSSIPEPASEAPMFTEAVAPIFQAKCGSCHGETALGGLVLTSYEGVLAGGANGPVAIAGEPETSSLIELQEVGGHPGQLDESELEVVRRWISAGMPE